MSNGHGFAMNLPILDGKNFDRWRSQMKAIFGFQEVYEIVQFGFQEIGDNATEAQRATYKEAKKKDCKALFLIPQCVNGDNFEKISGAETSKQAWDSLGKCYEGVAKIKKVKLQTLRRQFELLQMDESESVAAYMTKVLTISNKMKSCGKVMKDKTMVEKVLRTVTTKYDHIVVAIEESKNLDEYKFEELQGSLEAHESRLKERNPERNGNQALQAKFNKKIPGQWSKRHNEKSHRLRSNEPGTSSRRVDN
ncbi:PREDICTED: uncharacterized protein LOC109336858 [Lupinus angustifolius]|uniref:uncharacterized protein LOC109336858 n=1 Tax=Lupinus angustifolius TaxID=3871 RepID=UPI00092F581E|nr:PREDICTED: uncharacterized protein LOC109336858 [Lupinus angustifolius]